MQTSRHVLDRVFENSKTTNLHCLLMATSFIPPTKLEAFRFLFIDQDDYRLNTSIPTLTRIGIRKFAYIASIFKWIAEKYTSFQIFTMPHPASLIAGGIIASHLADRLVRDEEAPLIPISHEAQRSLLKVIQEESRLDEADYVADMCAKFFDKIMVGSSSARMMVFVGTKPLCWMLAHFLDQHFNQGTIGPICPPEDEGSDIIGVTVPFSKAVPSYFHCMPKR